MQNKRGRAYYSLLPLILFGVTAPAYFKLIYYVPADEILTHRVIWSFFFMVVLMSICRQWSYLKTLIQTPQKIFMLAVSAVLIGGNWLLFIWAVNNHHMLEASLGYFINPLVNIVLGDEFPRRAKLRPDAMAGGDSGDMWRVSPAVDFWFATYYRAGAGI